MSSTRRMAVEPLRRPDWLPADQWPFNSQVADVDGVPIHFIDTGGDGPILLFVQTAMWSFIWREVIIRLREPFRCVALDFPFSGLSSATGAAPTLAGHSLLLERFADGLGLAGFTPVLHDLAGPIGLAMAARRPSAIHGLVLTQTFAWPPRPRALRVMLRAMGSAPIRELNVATNIIPRITATSFGVGRAFDGPARRVFRHPIRRRHRRAFHHLMRDAARSGELLATIETALRGPLSDQPALTVFGEGNDPFDYQATWRDLFPHAHQVVVAGGHHFPMCDDPDQFATAITRWHTANHR